QWDNVTKAVSPTRGVALENGGIREPEPVDALPDIADQKAIRADTFATERLDDLVLRGVDVLVLIHEYQAKFPGPLLGEAGGLASLAVPKQAQSMLLDVVKIQQTQLTLVLAKGAVEFPRQPQQGGHLAADPVPVLVQRIGSVRGDSQTEQKRGIRIKFLE